MYKTIATLSLIFIQIKIKKNSNKIEVFLFEKKRGHFDSSSNNMNILKSNY